MRDTLPSPLSAAALRRELSFRGLRRAGALAHEVSFGSSCSVLYQPDDRQHGNFHPESFRCIQEDANWAKRLNKVYTGGRWIARRHDRLRKELDCATSSDALLMNVFCYPGLLENISFCSLLGVDQGTRPDFGYKPRIPCVTGGLDRTEVDMALGRLLIEAKLTESNFQKASSERILRYKDLDEILCLEELTVSNGLINGYQLIRGALAAHHLDMSFVVLCDARRVDLIEQWFAVLRSVRSCVLRSRLALLTWQEVASCVPVSLASFLEEKYGILPA